MRTWAPEMLARALVTPPPPHGPVTPKGRACSCSPILPSTNGNFSGPKLRQISTKSRSYRRSSRGDSNRVWNRLIPVVGGGFWEEDSGAGDDYVSTRGRKFNKEFNVLAKMLKQIEPLDTSVIGKGASDTSKEAMKRTISSMLGVLPSDRFQVTVGLSRQPLARLLHSSIITGYTLWNAEYRLTLQRNLDLSAEDVKDATSQTSEQLSCEDKEIEVINNNRVDSINDLLDEFHTVGRLDQLSQEAFNYITQLKSRIYEMQKELREHKQRQVCIETEKDNNNSLLDYLRSLEPDMVTQLSHPSSAEVEVVSQQLVQNVLKIFFPDDISTNIKFGETDSITKDGNLAEMACSSSPSQAAVPAPRDYLARLLFWCMLLGHHMRGLEYRLQLSCTVGI